MLEHYIDADRPEIISLLIINKMRESVTSLIDGFCSIYGRNPSSILDVGCGNGLMLSVAQDLGLMVLGIEPSKLMSKNARLKGVNVVGCSLEDFEDYAKFDLIVLNSVIEHLPDPSFALRILS